MLELLERILKRFDDNVLLTELTSEDAPAYALYQCYLALQAEDESLEELASEATTGDLKSAIQALDTEKQAALLDMRMHYVEEGNTEASSVAVNDNGNSVVEKIWNDAPLRRWLVKATVFFVFFIIILAIGIGFATAYYTGNISDGVFTNTVMNTGLEIFKLIFIAK